MVKRYDKHWEQGRETTNLYLSGIAEKENGAYVTYSDYQALEAENKRLREALESEDG